MEQLLRRTCVGAGATLALVMWLPSIAMVALGLWIGLEAPFARLLVIAGAFPSLMGAVGVIGWRRAPDRTATVAAVLGLVVIAALPVDVFGLLVWALIGMPPLNS